MSSMMRAGMSNAPERIWAFQSDGGKRGWLYTKPPQAIIDIPTEYVRADLHAALTEERDRLKDQRDYYKARDEEGERIQAEIEAERDRLAKANAELLADQRETLKAVLYHFGPEGAQKVTAHTLEQRKARALLDKHKATSTGGE